ncbi:MAG: hypothetical protein IPK23_15780 [Rhizobiales bacterium]|nr:hypothetical protein [Hyphomicrobiales bacterium]
MDALLVAENTGHQPIDVRPPALRALPVRVEAFDGIEVWCGAAGAVRCDLALIVTDLDLGQQRIRVGKESSIRTHSIAGPRLRTDCGLLKHFFETDFHPGSVALSRGYFSGSRYLVHAIPPRTDDGIWKHSLEQLSRCYEGLWQFAAKLKPARIALQLIPLGMTSALEEIARDVLSNRSAVSGHPNLTRP